MKREFMIFVVATVLASGVSTVSAQNEFAEITRLQKLNAHVSGIRSMADGEHYTVSTDEGILRFRYDSDTPGERLLPVGAPKVTDYAFSPDEQTILLASGATPIYRRSYTTTYYLVRDGKVTPALPDARAPRDASFSPDGKKIAYSDHNDLYVCDLEQASTLRITEDGEWNAVINGTTDWVYEEEFGATRAYAFSPDGRRLAYLRFDEREVPSMEMMRYEGKLYNRAFSFKYPKAGERNSVVSLWVFDLQTGQREHIDTGSETDQYIPRIGFTPDGRLWFSG